MEDTIAEGSGRSSEDFVFSTRNTPKFYEESIEGSCIHAQEIRGLAQSIADRNLPRIQRSAELCVRQKGPRRRLGFSGFQSFIEVPREIDEINWISRVEVTRSISRGYSDSLGRRAAQLRKYVLGNKANRWIQELWMSGVGTVGRMGKIRSAALKRFRAGPIIFKA